MPKSLQSVANALRVLQLLRSESEVGVTEVANRLNVSPSTAHRLLASLTEHDFVQQEASGRRYALGPAMTTSSEAQAINHCIDVAYPFMQQLRDESLETVHIAILTGNQVKFVASAESQRQVRVASRVGLSIPAHTSAAGKMLLSELPAESLYELYPEEELPARTGSTIRHRSRLEREVQQARVVGYGRNFGESEDDLAAIAVPISRPNNARTVCSLTLTGPASRINPHSTDGASEWELNLRSMLLRYASLISQRLMH